MGKSSRQQGRHSGRHAGPHETSRQRLKEEIAQLAARLLADGEAEGMGDAKRRAAERLGLRDARELPDNLAVLGAIVEYQRLFESEEAPARLASMRGVALEAMRALADFEPRLVGPVLYGTAFDHTAVTLHLHSDEPEAVVRRLLALRVSYRLGEQSLRTGRDTRESVMALETLLDGTPLELVVMSRQRLSNPPLSPLDGAPYRRLEAAGLAALLESPAAGEPLPEISALAPMPW